MSAWFLIYSSKKGPLSYTLMVDILVDLDVFLAQSSSHSPMTVAVSPLFPVRCPFVFSFAWSGAVLR